MDVMPEQTEAANCLLQDHAAHHGWDVRCCMLVLLVHLQMLQMVSLQSMGPAASCDATHLSTDDMPGSTRKNSANIAQVASLQDLAACQAHSEVHAKMACHAKRRMLALSRSPCK